MLQKIRTRIRKSLQPQVLRHDEDLLPVLVRPEDLRALADDQNAVVCVEEAEQIVRVRYDVSRRMLVRRHRIDLVHCESS